MNNCGCKHPAFGPEPHAPVPLHGGGFVPNEIEWLKKKIDKLFGTAVFTVNGHEPEGGNVDVIVPSKVSELENDAGYLTEHQDVSGIAATAEEALSVATDAAENSVRIVNGKAPTGGSVKIVLDDLADKDGNIETTKTIMVSRDGGESHVAVALYSDLINVIDAHNNNVSAHTRLVATIARDYATKTEVDAKKEETDAALENKLDKTFVVAPSASATAGQAADAKAVGEALKGKVDNVRGIIEEQLSVGKAADKTVIVGGSIRREMIGDDSAFVWFLNLPKKSGTFALTSDIEDAISGKANKTELPYAIVVKEIKNGAVSLDDRADNYVDARTLGSSDSLDIDFPVLVDGRSRDFVLAVECGENPPTISYAAFATIMAEDASTLTPEPGMNIYAFNEFKNNMFLAARKTVDTVVVNTPESSDQVLLAMQKRGIDTTDITDFGGVAETLGLGDTDTPQDAIDAVMN